MQRLRRHRKQLSEQTLPQQQQRLENYRFFFYHFLSSCRHKNVIYFAFNAYLWLVSAGPVCVCVCEIGVDFSSCREYVRYIPFFAMMHFDSIGTENIESMGRVRRGV